MSTFGVVRFREPFLFLSAGREVRLPSRRLPLDWGSGDCLDLCGKGGADVRPDFNWCKQSLELMGYR